MAQPDAVSMLNEQIRELHQYERGLEKDLELLRSTLERVQESISVVDAEGQLEYSNPAHAKLFGSPEELPWIKPFDRIHPEDRQKIQRMFEDTVTTGVSQQVQFRVAASDNSMRFIQSQGSPILDATDKVTKVVVFSRDITNLLAAQESLTELNREHEESNRASEGLNALADV